MVEIIHSTRDDADGAIDGELIRESCITIDVTHFDERTLSFKAFALVGGGFAAATDFRSSNFNIRRVVDVEHVHAHPECEYIKPTVVRRVPNRILSFFGFK